MSASQPVPPAACGSPSPTSHGSTQPLTAEEFNRQGLAKIPYLTGHGLPALELIDTESVRDEEPAPHSWDMDDPEHPQETVTLSMDIEETVLYSGTAVVPKAAYDEMVRLFPPRNDQDLPLGLVDVLIRRVGGRIVVDERHGNVQGQKPVGPVALERNDDGHQ